jgi:peptidylamidoglycolate lyase
MNRRTFLKTQSTLALGIPLLQMPYKNKDLVIGHNNHQYKVDLNWGALNATFYPVKDCHEMVQDSQGRILLLTNHTKNNIIIYSKSGQLLETWGTEYPGAHGLSLHVENGEDFLYITDYERHEVIKTTIDGKVVMTLAYPKESGKYEKPEQYLPTETAIADNGDIYVADGYGEQYILHYNAKGELRNVFGGKGSGPEHFHNAHGICIDKRDPENPCLLITERQQNKLKRFSLDGKYLSSIDLPGAFICRPVIHGKEVYLATIWSGDGSEGTGFVSILDEQNRLVSAPGACTPRYVNGLLQPMYKALDVFHHPHDVCVDEEGSIYVAQWNAGNTYPIKLIRV